MDRDHDLPPASQEEEESEGADLMEEDVMMQHEFDRAERKRTRSPTPSPSPVIPSQFRRLNEMPGLPFCSPPLSVEDDYGPPEFEEDAIWQDPYEEIDLSYKIPCAQNRQEHEYKETADGTHIYCPHCGHVISLIQIPAASVLGSQFLADPWKRSAAKSKLITHDLLCKFCQKERWAVAEITHKRGTQRVIYPSRVFSPFVHLGQDGSFGCVFSSIRLTDNLPVVIKQQPLENSGECQACMRELAVLTHFSNPELRHPNVIPIIKAWECDDSLYTVLPKLDCSLHTYVNEQHGSVPPSQRMEIFSQLLCGLRHIHHYGVIHRDFKPENVVLMRDLSSVQIIDFGSCRARVDGHAGTRGKYVSTYPYRAPEVEEGMYTAAADIWALGCILARMVQGSVLFRGPEASLEKDRLAVKDRIEEMKALATPYEYEVLRQCLCLDPVRRITTDCLYEKHYEHTKANTKIARFPPLSRHPPSKRHYYQEMEYEYHQVPTMRHNITVLISQCSTLFPV